MKRLRQWTLRLAAAGVVIGCLTGPAPGSVGACGQSFPVAIASRARE